MQQLDCPCLSYVSLNVDAQSAGTRARDSRLTIGGNSLTFPGICLPKTPIVYTNFFVTPNMGSDAVAIPWLAEYIHLD